MEKFKKTFNKLLINTLGISQELIKPNVHFTDDLGTDSLDLVELTIEFEKEFKITISDDDAEEIHTVKEAEEFLKSKLNIS